MVELSIVIPTLNEENFIKNILGDILNNTYKDHEVIVSDSGSEDKTRNIVKSFTEKHPNIRLVHARRGAAAARNDGATNARGEYILFLDADQRIPSNLLEKSVNEMKEKCLDIGGHYSKPTSKRFIDKLFWFMCNNFLFRPAQYVSPAASTGAGLIVKRSLHEKINGFDEGIHVTHDHDYVKRASRTGRFRMLRNAKSKFNMRRFDEEGRLKLYIKYSLLIIYHIFRSKKTPFKYEFGRHKR